MTVRVGGREGVPIPKTTKNPNPKSQHYNKNSGGCDRTGRLHTLLSGLLVCTLEILRVLALMLVLHEKSSSKAVASCCEGLGC
jgi:ribosomal protein S14